MGWKIPIWRVKCIQVWIGRVKGCMWPKNLLQVYPKSQMSCPLCQADSAHHSSAVASETHRNNFLVFCSLFSQDFALLSPDLRWEESTKLMQEAEQNPSRSPFSQHLKPAWCNGIPEGASPLIIPPQSCQPLGQHSLNCITPRASTWNIHTPMHQIQRATGSQLWSLRRQQEESSVSHFFPT